MRNPCWPSCAIPNRYLRIGGSSHLALLLAGYAVFDDAAMPIVGHRMAHTEHYPVRLRVDSFPTADELDRLHAVATLAKPVKTG